MLRKPQPAAALAFVFLALAAPFAQAMASAPAAAAAPSSSAFMQLIQVVLALVFVLALIVSAAWAMRKFSLVPGSVGGNRLRVVSGAMVGPKERVVIVEMDNTWLVVGVTSQSVNLLHTQERPADAPPVQVVSAPFAGKLADILKKRRGA